MKKIIVSIIIAILLFPLIVNSETEKIVEVNQGGGIRIREIEIEKEWRALIKTEMKAYKNPGKEIIEEESIIDCKNPNSFCELQTSEKTIVKFDSEKNKLIRKKIVEHRTKKNAAILIWYLVAVIIAGILNLLVKYSGNNYKHYYSHLDYSHLISNSESFYV